MPTPKRLISSRVAKQNPRPRKYASAAEKQAAFRARFPTICVRVEPKTADTIQKIGDASGRTQQETMLSLVKFALTNRDFVNLGLTEHKQLPRMEETRKANPMKRKPTPAQIAARERFAEMARSGAFKKKATKARKKNPSRSGIGFEGYDPYASIDRLDEYRQKSDAELRYIIQDAGEAARAQRGMSSEAKYLDQVNDATTVLYERRLAREKAIAASNRSGRKIGKREASAINRLLTGRSANPRASNPVATKRKANPVKPKVPKYTVQTLISGKANWKRVAMFDSLEQAKAYAEAVPRAYKVVAVRVIDDK